MALTRQPEEGAIALSEAEAIHYVWEIVGDWNRLSETWALQYGSSILGAISALTGAFINNHYRAKLKVGRYGYLSAFLPATLLPGMCSAFFHRHFIATNILLQKENCAICTEVKSAAIQSVFGMFYPASLAPAANLLLANRYATYRLPSLRYAPKDLFREFLRISRPLSVPLIGISAIQMMASSMLTYLEMKNHADIQKRLSHIERLYQAKV